MTIHILTAGILCFFAFLAGLILMGVLKDERWVRLRTKLVVATTERDRLKEELGSLNRQYYDMEHVLDMRGCELGQLRAEVLRLRGGLHVVKPGGDAA
jgi:hypothetical protein